jgi:ABC-type transport system involved in multi-copper enzyme maturation permease subunit
MMWHKAWLESRWRFVAGLVLVAGFAAVDIAQASIIMPRLGIPTDQFNRFVWHEYFTRVSLGWTLSTLLLTTGGLVREYALGTSLFSLSLPISRRRWLAIRTLMALGQSFVLSLVPVAVIPTVASLIGQSYPPWEAMKFSLLLFLTGLAAFSVGILCSSLIQGEYAAVALGIGFVFLCGMVANAVAPQGEYGDYITGRQHVDTAWHLTKGWPWWGIWGNIATAAVFIAGAAHHLEKRDF